MNDAESKIIAHINKYGFIRSSYERILNTFAAQDQSVSILYKVKENLRGSIASLLMTKFWMVTPEEARAFIRRLEVRAIGYYQRSLEKNYEALRQYKETGKEPCDFRYLILTVDRDGKPKKTRVIDVKDGAPVFEDGCEIKEIWHTMNQIDARVSDLSRWLDKSDTLRETLKKALKLKEQGPLGGETPPSPNYDLDGLVGGQLDAAAWQNYAIEMGMVRTVNYDYSLEELIPKLEKCIEFYEMATSIV